MFFFKSQSTLTKTEGQHLQTPKNKAGDLQHELDVRGSGGHRVRPSAWERAPVTANTGQPLLAGDTAGATGTPGTRPWRAGPPHLPEALQVDDEHVGQRPQAQRDAPLLQLLAVRAAPGVVGGELRRSRGMSRRHAGRGFP